MTPPQPGRIAQFVFSRQGLVAIGALSAIGVSLGLGWLGIEAPIPALPLWIAVGVGGTLMLWDIGRELVVGRSLGADILAAIAIVCAAVMDQWLVSAIIVLMLSGGEALESAATAHASAVLDALARRAPEIAHRIEPGQTTSTDITADQIAIGDRLVVLPHELCPVDGTVVEGHGVMDESYLTGEPYQITKSVGSAVMSGAVNGPDAMVIEATKRAQDSRYAQIVSVLTQAEGRRPRMRRLADRIGLWYAPLAVALGLAGWAWSGQPSRFLAVVVIATPCPLLIGVPVAIIGAISLSARAGIIIKDPGILERISTAQTMLFDKTGTLTYGRPELVNIALPGRPDMIPMTAADQANSGQFATTSEAEAVGRVLGLAAGVERYSRHPLAASIIQAAERWGVGGEADLPHPTRISERAGQGLVGDIGGQEIQITSRGGAASILGPQAAAALPPAVGGMECVVIVGGVYAATFRFRDTPRRDAKNFIEHLGPLHGISKTIMISGDRASEVEYVAQQVGISTVYADATPEQKLDIVRRETEIATTVFLGDGINDAPAMTAASVGIAFGSESDVTTEAAGAVVLDSSLERTDELLHIGRRMRVIALQSVLGGMVLSIIGMGLAVAGLLPPVVGAIAQEVIDLLAVLNAARVAMRRTPMADYADYDPTTRA